MNYRDFKYHRNKLLISCKSIYNYCEYLLKDINIRKWINSISKNLDLDEETLNIYIKNKISSYIDFNKNNSKIKNLQIRYLILDIFKCLLFLISVFFLRKKRKKNYFIKKYKLFIDHIESSDELDRYNKLIAFFSRKEIIVLAKNKEIINQNDIKIIYKPRFKNYSLSFKDLLKIFKLLISSIKYSLITRINILKIFISIIDSYLYYKSIFEEFQSEHIIMHQHYHTNSIKDDLFKQYNGKKTYVIQKNIHQLGKNCFYYNSDFLFTFGKLTANRAKEYGAKYKEIIVGSFFMEHYFYGRKKENNQFYDILLLGGNNFKKNGPFDTYDYQYEKYIEHLKWVRDYAKLNPSLKIGFKAHSNFDFNNTIEYNLFKDSNISLVDKKLNSYHLCSNSKIILSYASTMIIEMYGLNQNSFFLDPENYNDQFLDNTEEWKTLRINSFNKFNKLISNILKTKKISNQNYIKNNFCEESSNVSEKIYKHMMKRI
jgi:hypothetical protein